MRQKLERWLHGIWYEGASGSWLLRPLTWLFRCVLEVRKLAYRTGLLRTYQASMPVIVVGNITAGGVGKTPFVDWLVTCLQAHGYTPGIVTRGYGGSVVEPTRVLAHHTAKEVGDEALLLSRRLGVPVVVGARRSASVAMLGNSEVNVIVSDDGLQHYALGRDIEVCIVDERRGFGNGRLLPSGPLREPVTRLDSIDVVVYHRESLGAGQSGMALGNPRLRQLGDGTIHPLESLAGQRVHAVAGIGNPARFFGSLERAGLNISAHAFVDHHDYAPADVTFEDNCPVLMTEKDAVKCESFATPDFYSVVVDAVVSGDIESVILERLASARIAKHGGGN